MKPPAHLEATLEELVLLARPGIQSAQVFAILLVAQDAQEFVVSVEKLLRCSLLSEAKTRLRQGVERTAIAEQTDILNQILDRSLLRFVRRKEVAKLHA